MEKKITVLLVDDHRLVRSGFRRILEDEPDLTVVGETGDGLHAIQIARELAPAVVLMDYSLPKMNGLLAAQQIINTCPKTAIIMVSMHGEETRIAQAVQAGVKGYVVKTAGDMQLVSAIRRVAAGHLVFPSDFDHDSSKKDGEVSSLSTRERQILKLIAEGKSNPQIATHLSISVNTVAAHRSNIMKTLKIHKTAQLVLYAIREGLAAVS